MHFGCRNRSTMNYEFGFTSAFGEKSGNREINKIGISFNSDGTTSFFAELEKSSTRQREHIEKAREEKRAARKEQEKERLENRYLREDTSVKRTGRFQGILNILPAVFMLTFLHLWTIRKKCP